MHRSMTIATLFSGGEGVGCGARAAGLRHLWGIEVDDAIAQVARDNGFDVETADILEADPADYETPTVLHASPPCPNFSSAKQGRRESDYDVVLARATARFIEKLRPYFFTLENVYGYRKSQSWQIIADALNRCGYWFDLAHVNAADFGVPQTRKRMIVRAALGQMVPQLPPPEPWVGWYEAIEDLIPTLPESQFAPWQLARLKLDSTTLVDSAGYPDVSGVPVPVTRRGDEPANTVIANHARRGMRAFLMAGGGNTSFADAKPGRGMREANEPAHTVTTITVKGGAALRAFIVDGANAGRAPTVRLQNEPMFTVDAMRDSKHPRRAFLVGGQFAAPADGNGEPRPVQVRGQDKPTFTVTAVNKGDWRAWLAQGRVVQMTPRALARFQAFPDSYILPGNKTLACKVVGMAVPPLLYQKIVGQLIELRGDVRTPPPVSL